MSVHDFPHQVSAVVSRWTARFFTPLLRLGLDPMVHDGPPCCGENALHVAASYGNAAVVEALVAHAQSKAPAPAMRSAAALQALRVRSRAGLTALGLAAARGRRETACLLWAREQQYAADVGVQTDVATAPVPTEHRWTLEGCAHHGASSRSDAPAKGTHRAPAAVAAAVAAAAASGVAERDDDDQWGQGELSGELLGIALLPCGGSANMVTEAAAEASAASATSAASAAWPERFLREFYAPGRPLLLRGAALDWPMRRAWARQQLVVQHGMLRFTPAAVPFAASFGLAHSHSQSTRLRDFVGSLFADGVNADGVNGATGRTGNQSGASNSGTDTAPMYIFERSSAQGGAAAGGAATSAAAPPDAQHDAIGTLLAAARLPPMPALLARPKSPFQPQPAQFYLGPAGAGAPVHYHGDAFNVLAHGRKRWWLFPPETTNYSTVPASQWVREAVPDLCGRCERRELELRHCPLTLTQEAGDLLFVPRDWGHAVLNLQPAVGYAVEFDSPWSRSST